MIALKILGSLGLLAASGLEVGLLLYAIFKVNEWAEEGTDLRFALSLSITFILVAAVLVTVALNIYLTVLIWAPRVAEAL